MQDASCYRMVITLVTYPFRNFSGQDILTQTKLNDDELDGVDELKHDDLDLDQETIR